MNLGVVQYTLNREVLEIRSCKYLLNFIYRLISQLYTGFKIQVFSQDYSWENCVLHANDDYLHVYLLEYHNPYVFDLVLRP